MKHPPSAAASADGFFMRWRQEIPEAAQVYFHKATAAYLRHFRPRSWSITTVHSNRFDRRPSAYRHSRVYKLGL